MSSEQHYVLPLEAIIQIAKSASNPVILHAHLHSIPLLTREECVASVVIGHGVLTVCKIMNTHGHILKEGKEAYELLQHIGEVDWSLRSAALSTEKVFKQERLEPRQLSPPLQAADRSSWRPLRSVLSLTSHQQQLLSHAHRQVFALADGTKTIEHMALLLNKKPDMLLSLIHDLQVINVIYRNT